MVSDRGGMGRCCARRDVEGTATSKLQTYAAGINTKNGRSLIFRCLILGKGSRQHPDVWLEALTQFSYYP